MMNELKPCPFCGKSVARSGSVADIEMIDSDNELYEMWQECFSVVCDFLEGGCGSSVGGHDTEEEAIEAWNRRVSE